MAITKTKKSEILKDLNNIFAKAKTTVFVSYKGVPVNDQISIRRKLLSEGVNLKVTKKSLLKKILGEKGFTGSMPELKDEIAFATSEDLLASAREVFPWTKIFKTLSIVGGVFDGVYKSANEMMEIATIPSREVSLSKIAFLFNSPIQRFAIAINEVAKKK